MDRPYFIFLACILAGFSLLKVAPLSLLGSFQEIISLVAILTITIFSFAIIFNGIKALFKF